MGIVGADFNMVLKSSERSSGSTNSKDIDDFSTLIDSMDLNDLPLMGGRWTWNNLREHSSSSRIDRFLITTNLLAILPNLNQKLLARPTSDHFPILLVSDGIQWGPVPFRIDNKWLELDSFRKMVADTWNKMSIKGTSSYRIATKLKNLKAQKSQSCYKNMG